METLSLFVFLFGGGGGGAEWVVELLTANTHLFIVHTHTCMNARTHTHIHTQACTQTKTLNHTDKAKAMHKAKIHTGITTHV